MSVIRLVARRRRREGAPVGDNMQWWMVSKERQDGLKVKE
jgi:hypothetical protein